MSKNPPIKTFEVLQRHLAGTHQRIDRTHLTAQQKAEILELVAEGYLMKKSICAIYGVVQQTISGLLKRSNNP